jgi:hypothetical protein
LADLDGDGALDMLSGSYPGELYWFRHSTDGTFAARRTIVQEGGVALKCVRPILTLAIAPAAADWDGDGDVDLVLGNIAGEVLLARNDGSRTNPIFAAPQPLSCATGPIKVVGDAGPCIGDWNGDGVFDLLVGSATGEVVWYENVGSPVAPLLAAPRVLVAKNAGSIGLRAKPSICDWNADGRADLLVGDFTTERPELPALTPNEMAQAQVLQAQLERLTAQYKREYDALGLPALNARRRELGESSGNESDASREARQTELARVDAQIAQSSRELASLVDEMSALRARIPGANGELHGYVWYFERTAGG